MEKKVIILAGPSAAGKTTVMNRIVELHPEFEEALRPKEKKRKRAKKCDTGATNE